MTDRLDMPCSDEHDLRIFRQSEADQYALQESILKQRTGTEPTKQQVNAALVEWGWKKIEPFYADQRIGPLAKAQAGDLNELADLVRNGTALNEKEREFAADILLGKIPTVIGAPKKYEFRLAISALFFWRYEIDGLKREAVIAECEARFRRSRSTIEQHLSDGRKCDITQDTIIHYRNLISLGRDELILKYRGLDLDSR
tara:strand:+ start:90 stop:689 length:600 start_codon:yes stop_codon:yes gene_type:complete